VGATGSEELALLKGRVTAREARALGVQWILAPVVDLQSNPKNPIVNVRSFGEDPALVARLARAFMKGVHGGGAIACLKHFPGHGDVDQDSHLVLPRIGRDAESLRARELRPFAELVADTDAVMTAHLLIEAFDRERPASLSQAVTTGLLREEMRFGGLVCTDALMMGAIRSVSGSEEAALLAIAAGADVVLMPDRPAEAIAAIERAQAGAGGFGVVLLMAHDWADWEATNRSYELFARYVIPRFQDRLAARQESYDAAKAGRPALQARVEEGMADAARKYEQQQARSVGRKGAAE